MEIVGVGYRVTARGSDLEFALGFSHPVPVPAPEGISFEVQTPTKFVVRGIDKQRSEEHTSELQSRQYLVCRLLLEKKIIAVRAVASRTICQRELVVPFVLCYP